MGNRTRYDGRVYHVKYALSTGIRVFSDVDVSVTQEGGTEYLTNSGHSSQPHIFERKDGKMVAFTEDAARLKFEEMRAAKIKSMKKQIARLEKLEPKFVDISPQSEEE